MEISNKVAAFFVEIFQQNRIFFWLNFSIKTAQTLERILRQTTIHFGENFHKINSSAKISAQQRCHAARVFVTLRTLQIRVDHSVESLVHGRHCVDINISTELFIVLLLLFIGTPYWGDNVTSKSPAFCNSAPGML